MLAYRSAHLLDPSRQDVRRSLRDAIRNLAPGAALLVGVGALARAAKTGRHAAKLEALRPYAGWLTGAAALLLAASWAIWLWRRTAGLTRLASEEPELYALYRRLEEEKRAGWTGT